HSCKQTDWVPTGHNTQTKQETMPIEVTELMKDFLLNKDFDGFLLTLIKVESFDRKTFAISELAIDLFDDWETFEKVLTKKDEEDSNFLHEFKKFMAVFASKNYSQYVDFEFKDIPIQEKINKS
ncbi:MAG: hypothetical protein OQJ88_03420, partial [Flavobacteriales bacterium]|nr:hypothetical protein [Flavobacteriales bacterium]